MGNKMKNLIVTLLSCLLYIAVSAQKTHPKLRLSTPAEEKIAERNNECVHRNTYTTSQRNKFYPFSTATQIRFVSFHETTRRVIDHLPIKYGSVDYSKLLEIKTLNKQQRDELTDILYNVKERNANRSVYEGGCYEPHNAILFVDKRGHTFAFIEICFHCLRFRQSSRKFRLAEFCEGKYDLIKKCFESAGIKIGITE
jgi:hypothetical protein